MPRFCVRCGREESDNVKIIGYLCVDCYIKEKDIALVPKRIDIVSCPSCGSVKIGSTWLSSKDFSDDLAIPLAIILTQKIKALDEFRNMHIKDLRLVPREDKLFAEVDIGGEIKDIELVKTYLIEINFVKRLCPTCLAHKTKTYEAVIQIRGVPRLSKELSEEIREYIDNLPTNLKSYISEISNVRGGIDLKITSKAIAMSIANNIIKSYRGYISNMTEENIKQTPAGKVSKKIISIRILDLRENDVIEIRGSRYLVSRVGSDNIVIIDRSGVKRSFSYDELIDLLKKRSYI